MSISRLACSFRSRAIAPEGFVGIELGEPANVWIPLMMEGTARPLFPVFDSRVFSSLAAIGRLKPGIALEQAQAGRSHQSLSSLATRLENQLVRQFGKRQRVRTGPAKFC